MTPYIGKNDLVAEIKRQLFAIDKCPKLTDTQIAVLEGNKIVLTKLLSFIDTLEVKEVDLEKEIEEVKHNYKVDDSRHTSICSADIEWLAKHFYELGLKAKEG